MKSSTLIFAAQVYPLMTKPPKREDKTKMKDVLTLGEQKFPHS